MLDHFKCFARTKGHVCSLRTDHVCSSEHAYKAVPAAACSLQQAPPCPQTLTFQALGVGHARKREASRVGQCQGAFVQCVMSNHFQCLAEQPNTLHPCGVRMFRGIRCCVSAALQKRSTFACIHNMQMTDLGWESSEG